MRGRTRYEPPSHSADLEVDLVLGYNMTLRERGLCDRLRDRVYTEAPATRQQCIGISFPTNKQFPSACLEKHGSQPRCEIVLANYYTRVAHKFGPISRQRRFHKFGTLVPYSPDLLTRCILTALGFKHDTKNMLSLCRIFPSSARSWRFTLPIAGCRLHLAHVERDPKG